MEVKVLNQNKNDNDDTFYAIYSRKSKFTGKGESIENQIELCKNQLINKYNIEKYIVTAFYDNLKSVAEVSDKVKYFLKEKGIRINKISLRHHDDVSKLYKLLRELSVSNHDTWSSLFLFSSLQKQILEMKDEIDIMDRSIRLLENYALQYEIAIKNYYSKKDAISILL